MAAITRLLEEFRGGNDRAADRLLPLVYDELRRLAQTYLREERQGHTLQATALVHEAYLRLVDQTRVQWQGRAHFFAVAAQAIRRILVDHARGRGREKRGGNAPRLSLDQVIEVGVAPDTSILALDRALDGLAARHPLPARVVELRFFGGLTSEETAGVLDLSTRTAERHWQFARAWLYRELAEGDEDAPARGRPGTTDPLGSPDPPPPDER